MKDIDGVYRDIDHLINHYLVESNTIHPDDICLQPFAYIFDVISAYSNLRHATFTYLSLIHKTVFILSTPLVFHHYSIHYPTKLQLLSTASIYFPLPGLVVSPDNIIFHPLSSSFILLDINYHHSLVVSFTIVCMKQVLCMFVYCIPF